MGTEDDDLYGGRVDRMVKRWMQEKNEGIRRHNDRQAGRIRRLADHIVGPEAVIEKRSVPIATRCSVLVVGGGPAGLSAAIAAARAGADTMIIERFGCFGGVITTVGMETLGWYRYEGTTDSVGIGAEMERLAKRFGGSPKFPFNDSTCLDAEAFKLIADRLLQEAGVRPRLHTFVVDAIMRDGVIRGVIVESKSGREAILADRVVDCSGDADVAHFAGAEFTTLPIEKNLGVSQVFNVAGVDKQRFLEYTKKRPGTFAEWESGWDYETTGKEAQYRSPFWDSEFATAKEEGIIPQDPKDVAICGTWSGLSDAGEATNLNLVHLTGVDCTNVEDLTRAEMDGREHVQHALKALQHKVPGFERAKLRNYGMTIGVRDSRKIVGRYNLTGVDVTSEARFADSIGIWPEFIDGYNILVLPTTGRYMHIPLGALIPKDVDNLLVAGRCIAGDAVAHASTRNMMCCTVTGQGAGVAAAVSVRLGQTAHSVDVAAVQAELRQQQVRID